jgi:hypothetical protein
MSLRARTFRDDELYVMLREVYDAFNDVMARLDFRNIADRNRVSNSVWALSLLSCRLRHLCASVLSCNDQYSASILYRSFVEHLVKHTYIFVSCAKDGDGVGTEYTSSEHMSYELFLKLLKTRWPDSRQVVPSKSDEFKKVKKQAQETLHQFTFAEVTRSLLGALDAHDDDAIKGLRQAILDYSTLSSYVHAGPLAVLDLEEKPRQSMNASCIILTLYPSEHQGTLRALRTAIHEKAHRAMAIHDERMKGANDPNERDGGQRG